MFRVSLRAPVLTRQRIVTHNFSRKLLTSACPTTRHAWKPNVLLGTAFVAATGILAWQTGPIFLDSEVNMFPMESSEDFVVDEDSSIAFPKVLKVQSKSRLPPFTLVGVGVRTVSFLGIRVYSVGFYADLNNPQLQIPISATPEDKIDHIVRNTACMLRIVPTRSTNYTHLRDGFVRAIQARMAAVRKLGGLDQGQDLEAQSAVRQLQTLFPNTPLAKGTALDIILTAPEAGSPKRALIFRDLGVIVDEWVSREFVMAYFEGKGISPPLKNKVVAALTQYGK